MLGLKKGRLNNKKVSTRTWRGVWVEGPTEESHRLESDSGKTQEVPKKKIGNLIESIEGCAMKKALNYL